MQDIKKDFQKTIAHIRTERNAGRITPSEYPKAMMTGQQATKTPQCESCKYYVVNCCACLYPELEDKKVKHKNSWQWCRHYKLAKATSNIV